MKLFDYAYCPKFSDKIDYLAKMSPEDWGQHDGYKANPILHNYIKFTFSKLYSEFENANSIEEENCVFSTEKNKYFMFNTGLYDTNWESIYAYFTPNKSTVDDANEWYFEAFFTEYTLRTMGINAFPNKANYFNYMNDLVFNVHYKIVPQYNHIFDKTNISRFPESLRNNFMRREIFDSAIQRTTKMIDANYKIAVPQYFENKIQLLIPIYLTNPNTADLALVLTRDDQNKCYLGHTCLTADMAYNNARLICKPNSDWLIP